MEESRLLIGGEWQDGVERSDVLDKFFLTPFARMHIPSREQVRNAVAAAHEAYVQSTLTAYDRGAILDRAAQIVERDDDRFVERIRTEAGFTKSDAQNELRRCMQTFRVSADEARRLTGEMIPLDFSRQLAVGHGVPCLLL